MTHGHRSSTVRLRIVLVLVLAALAALVIAIASGAIETRPDTRPDARPDRPGWRPRLHLTPAHGWMNDVQRPLLVDGRWRLYNLVNPDYPGANGTSWQAAESTDLVHWKVAGTAIEKYRNGLGDVETGSAVVDTHDTSGFGPGAVVVIATQQLDGVQRQSLFYSRDGGRTFGSYRGNPVLDNPGAADFRDPKVVWDGRRHQWLMVLAEGQRIGFYTSPDLKHWTYVSDYARGDLGTLECPDLFRMSVVGDPSRTTWVLGTSANGASSGGTAGYAYWTGRWDGRRFTADRPDPLWLDHGSDFYAGVTWSDPRRSVSGQLAERYAIGWMNNWSYARDVPGLPSTGGPNTLVRRLRLADVAGRPTLVSSPIGLGAAVEAEVRGHTGSVSSTATIGRTDRRTFRLHVRLRRHGAQESRIVVGAEDGSQLTIGYDWGRRQAFVVRDADAIARRMPKTYRQVRTATTDPLADGSVDLDLVVDGAATEVFVNHGVASLSDLVFLGPGPRTINAESVGGSTDVDAADLSVLGG
ncbi:2,6-beta-fructan 6-levanbiohydrolase [Nocardioides panacihumi]|uniref:2,6-beta-fructan 6-levanbiohydrolase n=1 Tax=Nocardioides panacihumi TaxID=400774 RepID=A0ABP5C354_9ACTN